MAKVSRLQILELLRNGSSDDRMAFVEELPPNSFKDSAIRLVGANNPGMVVIAFSSMIPEYCYGRNAEVGAELASAVHERAIELWETIPHHGLLSTTLSALAVHHLKALSLLGRSNEILEVSGPYIDRYERLNEMTNLPTLRVLRIEALLNLRRIDDAANELNDEALLQHPIVGMEARRLKGWVDRYMEDPRTPKIDPSPTPTAPDAADLLANATKMIGLAVGGEQRKEFGKVVDPGSRVECTDPEQLKGLLETLRCAEKFFVRGGTDSELVFRSRIRDASAIFWLGTPSRERILQSLSELESSLGWAREHRVSELINDALWGIYLCHSRLRQPSAAADALIELRGSLEGMRAGIKDPMKRGGIFGNYGYLFNAMCEKLQEAGRFDDLLKAIESSKGRVIADRLTQQRDEVVPDPAIYCCVDRLPELTIQEGFHYLTFFVNEEHVYSVLVSNRGQIRGIDPIPIKRAELRGASRSIKPSEWGKRKPSSPDSRYENVSEFLKPLVEWLGDFLDEGIVKEGDHICYSSDDDFHNVPLHYLSFRDGIVLDHFSVSRVHSAFQLVRLLSTDVRAPHDRFVGFVVPLRQDIRADGSERMLADMHAPLHWLEAHGLSGETVRLAEATPKKVKDSELARAIVHFSTHGWFPKDGNPFSESYLLLADGKGLPDIERVTSGQHQGRLTPENILEANLDLEGSHVSMMACLTGLAKEGIAGDILGLDWALIQCGVSSLISTHWKISAASAARFFERFYEKWIEKKQSRASAWRETMLDRIRGDHTPASLDRWSGFSLTGDFR